MRIFLDDERPAHEGWVLAKDHFEFSKLILNHQNEITELSLDFYLGFKKRNGFEIVTNLIHQLDRGRWSLPKLERIILHSSDKGYRDMMEEVLEISFRAGNFPANLEISQRWDL
jgi:hypothetical protein